MNNKYDIIIVGGGMVGATLACALADSQLQIAVIEPNLPQAFDPEQPHDLRVSALNIASQTILENIGAWEGVIGRRSCVYRRLKTWELDEQRAATLFDCKEQGVDHLGYIVENRVVQLALLERMAQLSNVTLIHCETSSIDFNPGASIVELADGQQLLAKLLVGADGGNSMVRSAAGIGIHSWDYEQSALVISVLMDAQQQDITWQQFTPTGPLAFLPLSGNCASLVWYNTPANIKALLELDEADFLQQLLEHFPSSLKKVDKVMTRAAFPLKRQHAQQYVREGVALIGDAAHMIHPLAGQGVNIGLLDAAQLAQNLKAAVAENFASAEEYALIPKGDISSLMTLQQYQQQRRKHNLLMMQLMDSFYRIFSNDLAPLKLLRNLGLGLADKILPAKKKAMALAMGMEGPLPDLAKKY
ncbi:MAG: ubiH/UbiF/VisC/COQ6 family Ubiquinone biosynthesis hydroxylase [Osedax symbiont Rs2]|nr:MAG: ubiH/UbiF/VisC/COQ6 family Ubiquinone biosynthesis hydroxylase [Osedax symbiont Rs2]